MKKDIHQNSFIQSEKEKNWTDIDKNFAKKRQQYKWYQHWEEKGLTYQDAQEWIPAGFEPRHLLVVKKWKENGFTAQETKQWISVGFRPSDWGEKVKEWEKAGFTYQKINEWIAIGFKPEDCYEVKKWINKGFTPQKTKEWMAIGFKRKDYYEVYKWKNLGFTLNQTQELLSIGLTKNDYGLAVYLRDYLTVKNNKSQSDEVINLEKLRKEYWKSHLTHDAQEYLDKNYPKNKRKNITKLDITLQKLNFRFWLFFWITA